MTGVARSAVSFIVDRDEIGLKAAS